MFWENIKEAITSISSNKMRSLLTMLGIIIGISSVIIITTIGGSIQSTLTCLLYTSPSPRDGLLSRMPSSA